MARTILILGPSGRGKSTSLRNLDPATSVVINTERKSLPFKGSKNFSDLRPTSIKETMAFMKKAAAGKKAKTIIIDSFSAFTDQLLAEARIVKSGWDVFTYYNETLFKFFEVVREINDSGKNIIIIGHEEYLEGEGGAQRVALKVKGKEWSGVVEKEFDIVLYAHSIVEGADSVKYLFRTQTDGICPAKSPMEMFEDITIENDCQIVLDAIEKYDN
tara:strand:+ start:666 stop:1313 length:648 start_codon:yes stop_codon:yes gene_type:complete